MSGSSGHAGAKRGESSTTNTEVPPGVVLRLEPAPWGASAG